MVYVLIFVGIIVLNVVPFFMPATWTVLAALAAMAHIELIYVPIIGAVGATIGRTILAKFSRSIVRTNFLSEKTQQNIDAIKTVIEKKKQLTITAFLLYALGPLPTNYLFISYGLTTLPLRYLVVPFFIGRLLSYSFWVYIGYEVGNAVHHSLLGKSYSAYFIVTQLLTIAAVYAFTKVNWRRIARRIS